MCRSKLLDLRLFLKDHDMSADGKWSLVVMTPMGDRQSILSLRTDGNVLAGSQTADGNSTPIFDGTVNGNEVSWKVSITDPMPMTLEFTGTVNGNELNGDVKLGSFGSSSFSGIRA
jgi:hypothetical protein